MSNQKFCTHNPNVICEAVRCSIKCGWHPREIKRRKKMTAALKPAEIVGVKVTQSIIVKGGKESAD